MTSRQSKEDYI